MLSSMIATYVTKTDKYIDIYIFLRSYHDYLELGHNVIENEVSCSQGF